MGGDLRQLHPARVRRAVEADARFFAENIREADRREIQAAVGPLDVRDVLLQGLQESALALAVVGEKPAVLCGVRRCAEVGVVWAVATDEASKRARDWVSLAPAVLRRLHRAAGGLPLWNMVDTRNHMHMRWLAWAGAVFTGFSVTRHSPDVHFAEFVIHV